MDHEWTLAVSIGLTAVGAVLAAVGLLLVLSSRDRVRRDIMFGDASDGTVFIFDGEVLVDATPQARSLLAAAPVRGSSWQRLMGFLAPSFPGFDDQMAKLAAKGRIVLESADAKDGLTVIAEWRGGLARITVTDMGSSITTNLVDPLTQRANDEELRLLRGTVHHVPLPIWLESGEGDVVWANPAYMALVPRHFGPDREIGWPLPKVMTAQGTERQRLRMAQADGTTAWFEVTSKPATEGRMHFAVPVDALVQTESSLAEFTQTLTKTFAELPIGLAVFDNQRRLALFNPALCDLTTLPPDVLLTRPALFDFLDRLRDRRMIPEPKDYASWRRRIVDLEKAAASGCYEETWILPGGKTFRVTGRPHPDGALALLFEDISTEMTRTRRFRADVELGQSVIDAMDEAVAVFSASGLVVLANAAYASLWGHDPAASVSEEASIGRMLQHWQEQTAPTPLWQKAEDFVARLDDRRPWSGEARLSDGRQLQCRFLPLGGGATMIAFRARVDEGDAPHPALLSA